MAERPIPLVMCTGLPQENSALLMQALESAAADVIRKPPVDVRRFLQENLALGSATRSRPPQGPASAAPPPERRAARSSTSRRKRSSPPM